jgi:hypothetical protein
MRPQMLLLVAALAAATAISTGGATANESRFDREPIAREHLSAPIAQDFRFLEEGRLHADGVESTDSHVAKTGLWGSIKKGVKKAAGAAKNVAVGAAKAVGTAAKRAGTGVASNVVRAAKAVAKSPLGDTIKKQVSSVKKTVGQVVKAVKKFLAKKKA